MWMFVASRYVSSQAAKESWIDFERQKKSLNITIKLVIISSRSIINFLFCWHDGVMNQLTDKYIL